MAALLFKALFTVLILGAATGASRAMVRFENTGTTSGWTTLWQEDQGSLLMTNNPTYKGPTAVRCRTIFRPTYRGRYHTELRKGGQATLGMERYYGFAFYLPPDWQFVNQSFNIQQFIGNADGCSGGQPATMTRLLGRTFETRITTGPDGCTRSHQHFIVTTNVTAGEWHRVVFRGKWAADNTGIFQFWYDGQLVVDQQNVPTIPNDDTVFNLALGNYSNGWHDDGFMVGTQSVRDVYIDHVRTGDSYAEVDPEAWAGPADNGQFALDVTPSAPHLTPGSNLFYNVLVVPFNGFGSNVTLAIRGLPANVAANFNPTNLNPNESATLTLLAVTNTVPGDYTLTLTGTSGLLAVTNTIFLHVKELAPSPETFIVAVDNGYGLRSASTTVQNSGEVLQVKRLNDSNTRISYVRFNLASFLAYHAASNLTGATLRLFVPGTNSGAGSLNVYGLLDAVGGTNGFDGAWSGATLTWNNQPAKTAAPNDIPNNTAALPNTNTTALLGSGVIPSTGECAVTLDPSQVRSFLGADSNGQITLLCVNNSSTIVSFASLANSGGFSQPVLELVAPVSDFSIAVSPSEQTVTGGSNAVFTVTIEGTNGFTGSTTLSAVVPAGLTASFNPETIGLGASTVTFDASAEMPPGTYLIPVLATSGPLEHAAMVSLTVIAADTDADGVPDWWTQQHFGHGTGQGADESRATDDPDADGAANLAEYLAGTNPTDAGSYLRVISVASQTNGVVVSWSAIGGRSYVVQSAESPANGFVDISPAIDVPGAGEAATNFTDNVPSSAARFYRVRLGP